METVILLPYPDCGELPLPLKDIEYLSAFVHKPSLIKMTEEMPEEIKQIAAQFESKWSHLKTALSFVYDGVYTPEEMQIEQMRADVKTLHDQLVAAGYGKTEMTE